MLGTSAALHKYRESLIKRVFNAAEQGDHFGLVKLFAEKTKWLHQPLGEREVGAVRGLYVFLRGIEKDPLPDDRAAFQEFMEANKGQPQSVRALNLLQEKSENEEERDRYWRDNPDGFAPQ